MTQDSLFLKTAKEKVLFLDGAMGTSLFSYDLSLEDYGGDQFDGCPENLNYTKPEIIKEIHKSFLKAGADIIETNTFGASKHVLAEYGLEDKAFEVSKLAASLAREAIDEYYASHCKKQSNEAIDGSPRYARDDKANARDDKHRFVAGSMGPGTKLPSLGHISYDKLRDSYIDCVKGLVEGGADYILIETCQDPLQFKAAIDATYTAYREIDAENKDLNNDELAKKYPRAIIQKAKDDGISARLRFPVAVQVTVETTGTLLVGSEIAAALTTTSAYPVDIIGMNCATGPKEMTEHVKYLCENTDMLVSCVPNAGIPENRGGHPYYPLGPDNLAKALKHFVDDFGVNIVGGCCGTTAKHIKAIADEIGHHKHKERKINLEDNCSSLYASSPMQVEPAPLIVGERTNANGSRAFKNLLDAEDYESIVALAKGQEEEGAQFLDVCTAYVGRDEVKDMQEVISRLNSSINIPIMVDSTEYPVLEEALKYISGKALINSVNLEDGEERVAQIAHLANRYGAALVVLTIDEDGMAKTAKKKLEVAERLYELLVNKHGVNPRDLIFDTLTFTLGSGDEDLRSAGIETIEAIRLIKEKFPETKTILGVSNISFGLDAKVRAPLNSIFIHECVKAGLDMAIANSKKIIPLNQLEEKLRKYCEDTVFDRRQYKEDDGEEVIYDPLHELMACISEIKESKEEIKNPYEGLTVGQTLHQRIIDGNKIGVEEDLKEALKDNKPLEIVNKYLMKGMKVVGELFGSGEMQLPFVLQSATTMKASVSFLEPYIEEEMKESGQAGGSTTKGTIVLATVKGDVHDIGKNLVDIILSNNGYKVVNLGIKQNVEDILKAADEHKPDVIGLSGLLVKSTLIMKQNLEIMEERAYKVPVILGGAALTRRYVEEDCQNVYSGKVYYGFDAFTDLKILNAIIEDDQETLKSLIKTKPQAAISDEVYQEVQEGLREEEAIAKGIKTIDSDAKSGKLKAISPFDFTESSSQLETLSKIPEPPFYGTKVIEDIDLNEIWKFLNLDALFIGQWQFKKGTRSKEAYEKELNEKIYPKLEELKASAIKEKWLEPKAIYGYFPAKPDEKNPNILNIYNEKKEKVIETYKFPRQLEGENLCLTDYFKTNNGDFNTVAFQIVTVGQVAQEYFQKLYADNKFDDYLFANGLSVEGTEALAEYTHTLIRKELGFAAEDNSDIKKLLRSNYHGMRYSFGYPACPRLEDHEQLFRLLKPERIGVTLTEEWQLNPEQCTSAIIVHNDNAKYFNVKGH